jgi:hypothetical protein
MQFLGFHAADKGCGSSLVLLHQQAYKLVLQAEED